MKTGRKKVLEFLGVVAFLFVIVAGAYSYANLGVFNNIDNAINVFQDLGWFVGTFAFATLFTAYLVVVADMPFIFRFMAIPAWLAFSFTLLVALDQFLGYSYPSIPPQAKLLSYRIIRDPNTNQRIVEAWMYLSEEHRTRAYRFPYERNQEEALYRAMRAKARGQKVEVELNPETDDENRPKPEDMIVHDIRHKGLATKEYDDEGLLIEGDKRKGGVDDMGSHRDSDPILLQLPGGGSFEIEPGMSFSVTIDGEIELHDPEYDKKQQNKGPTPGAGPH